MKFLKFATVALLLSTAFFSCSKDNNDDDFNSNNGNTTVEGKWVGTYGYGMEAPSIYYCLNIKAGGVIEELNSSGASKCLSGTWSMNGNVLSAKYQWKAPLLTKFSIAATFNAATGKLSGTWGYDDNATNGGKWEQTKQ